MFRITRVRVADVSPIGAVSVVRLVSRARIEAGGVVLNKRSVSNLNGNWTTAAGTAIGVRSPVNLHDAFANVSLLPRINGIVGGEGRYRRNDRARGEHYKAEKRSQHGFCSPPPEAVTDLRHSSRAGQYTDLPVFCRLSYVDYRHDRLREGPQGQKTRSFDRISRGVPEERKGRLTERLPQERLCRGSMPADRP
jgi:hypothetical protein